MCQELRMTPVCAPLADRSSELADITAGNEGNRQTGCGQSPGDRQLDASLCFKHNDFRVYGGQRTGEFRNPGLVGGGDPLLTYWPCGGLQAGAADVQTYKNSCIH